MKILLLSRYGRSGASSRIRSYQYLPYLEKKGFSFHICPLFNDQYVYRLQLGKQISLSYIISAYFHRLAHIICYRHIDIIWMEKEILPWLPHWIERLFLKSHIPYIVDYDDAVFHRYDLHGNWLIRRILGKKIDRIMKNANIVIAGNRYLEKKAKQAGAVKTAILPSVIDLERYQIKTDRQRDAFTIGWIGSSTTTINLDLVIPALEHLRKEKRVKILFVGSQQFESSNLNPEMRKWSEETEVADIRGMDVGIMPLPDTPWARGKCGYKLIQYMACGLPVVASPVEANLDIVKQGVNGYLALGTEEWISALSRLSDDPELRCRMGKAGRKMVEEKYCIQVTAPHLLTLLSDV